MHLTNEGVRIGHINENRLGEQSVKSSRSKFKGKWISENGSEQINCKVVDNTLQCTWHNRFVETFELESGNLKGIENPETLGFPSKDGSTFWSTGNRWIKECKYQQVKC